MAVVLCHPAHELVVKWQYESEHGFPFILDYRDVHLLSSFALFCEPNSSMKSYSIGSSRIIL